ncbi:YokU family protein [Brevibacillus reuszeri]|uniref:YokU family protein n=1 Tax=Brevibacillus reuszeri TaxID=54915 RepID=UPI003D2603DD
MICVWCNEDKARETTKECYWVLPDGASTVKILQVPAMECLDCGIYLEDDLNEKVEDKIYTSDLSGYSDVFTYEELMKAPTI